MRRMQKERKVAVANFAITARLALLETLKQNKEVINQLNIFLEKNNSLDVVELISKNNGVNLWSPLKS